MMGNVMRKPSTRAAAASILARSRFRPKLALVLGSGFDCTLDSQAEARIPYSRIAGFPRPGVAGHTGELVIGRLGGEPVFVLRGRAHFYEGHPMSAVTFAVRTLVECGINDLLLTNAAGGINPRLRVGDFMVIEDHLNLIGVNPLLGMDGSAASRFVDLSQVYDAGLRRLLYDAARNCGLKLKQGVYAALSGPTYETPAEIRALAMLGADAVGMSTVPEAIVARHCGLRVAALSLITNLAAGRAKSVLSHSEVLQTGIRLRAATGKLLTQFAKLYHIRPRANLEKLSD